MNLKALKFNLTTLALTVFSGLQADIPCWDNYCCGEPTFLMSAQPCGEDCGPFLGAQFLYLTTYETFTDYASDAALVTVGDTFFTEPVGKIHHFRPNWDPGVRLIAGYRLGEDGWDARFVYTYFHNTSHSHATPTEGDRLLTNLFPHTLALSSAAATAKKSLNYNTADFLFTRPYIVSCTHLVRPFFGVRGLWLNQKQRVNYESLIGFTGTDGRVRWNSRWEAVGLHAGFDYTLHICDCLSISADFAASLLAARQKQHYVATEVVSETGDLIVTFADYKEKELICLPGYELGASLNWETEICCMCVVFSIGYEMHQWFNTPTIRRFDLFTENISSNNNSNFMIHGGNIAANVYF